MIFYAFQNLIHVHFNRIDKYANSYEFLFVSNFQSSPSPDDDEPQLLSTKVNLKSFIERWMHPDSPIIIEESSTLSLPVQDTEKNTSSGFSSRGCSPSPCESLSSNTELFNSGMSPDSAVPNDDFQPDTDIKAPKEHFERPGSSASVDHQSKTKQEYLQSFDRRHSDSNYVINQKSTLEKINLAEEIKKLSDRLMVLTSINDELKEFNKRFDNDIKSTVSATETIAQPPAKRSEVLKNMKTASFNCSSTKTEKIQSQLVHSKSLMTEEEEATSSRISTKSVVNDLTERLKTLDEIPSMFENVAHRTTFTERSTFDQRLHSNSTSTSSSSSTSPCTFGSAPWPITNRRTKFRVTQLSRDVPIDSPNSHQTIFLEEAANSTKDCLLQLLDKYNGKEMRICNIRRHQSIAVGNGMTDNLEYHSMNSINTFFKRNVFQQNGTTVRKIKARIESKRH